MIDNEKLKNNPFTTPPEYFSELEKDLWLHTQIKDSLKTPDNYFEELEESIYKQTISKEQKGKVISLFSKKIYWAAASILLAGSISIYTWNNHNNSQQAALAHYDNINIIENTSDVQLQNEQSKEIVTKKIMPKEKVFVSHKPSIQKGKKNQTNQLSEKSSEVIYDLYFEDATNMEDEDFDSLFL